MKIAVIIPTWNREKNIVQTVKALLWQNVSLDTEYKIYVVDDHSTDGTKEALKDFNITILDTPQHTTWNASIPRNFGAKATDPDTDLLYFVDSDVLLPPDRVQRAVDIFAKYPHPNRVIIGAYHFMTKFIEAKDSNWHKQDITEYDQDLRWKQFQENNPDKTNTGLYFALACFGGNLVIPRKLFFKTGGFDELLQSGVEDGDFGLTLWETGALFSMDLGLLGWHNPHDIHKERTQFIPEGLERINSKHQLDIVKLTNKVYRKWGIDWTPPDSWVEESGYKKEELLNET